MFDDDKSGKLDFVEYMMAVQSTQLKSPEEKLTWIFRMYDKVGEIFPYHYRYYPRLNEILRITINFRTFPAPLKSRSFDKCSLLYLK